MNGANEVLVKAYLDNKIGFYDIPYFIEKALAEFYHGERAESEQMIYDTDSDVRKYVEDLILSR